jgi:hypothetical protein
MNEKNKKNENYNDENFKKLIITNFTPKILFLISIFTDDCGCNNVILFISLSKSGKKS